MIPKLYLAGCVLTQEYLRSILSYNKDTGDFIRLFRTSNSTKIGDKAGTAHNSGYVSISVLNKRYLAHRLAWFYITGKWPKNQIDHINGIRTDNRWDNLREASQNINSQNLKRAKKHNSSTGLLGVYPNHNRFGAKITVKSREIYIGTFDTPEEAYKAYLHAKRERHPGCTI